MYFYDLIKLCLIISDIYLNGIFTSVQISCYMNTFSNEIIALNEDEIYIWSKINIYSSLKLFMLFVFGYYF